VRAPTVDFALVFLGWLALLVVFALHRWERGTPAETRRDPAYLIGLLLQSAAFALVFRIERDAFPFNPFRTALIVVLEAASLGLLIAALRALGRQWAVAARLVEGHELVRSGPYAFLRHPIYTAMFGLMLATGTAWGDWRALGIAVVLYALGTHFRIRAEERLLRRQFGATYDDYARRVPAFIPAFGRGTVSIRKR
jgi:protein-S-isoprenylcysteine O-methyltransferase Ste14